MRTYKQLTQSQRYQIYALNQAGQKQIVIAQILGVHKSTISRELRRNRGRQGYKPAQAHRLTMERRRKKHKRQILDSTWHLVEFFLRQEWSPEQVSHWLRLQIGLQVSHERIYQHII